MEHKAFVFNYNNFKVEFELILIKALATSELEPLYNFIFENFNELKDPYEGEPLDEDWKDLLEVEDVHQLGDFALTKYYDPSDDIGLGCDWNELNDSFLEVVHEGPSPVLGSTVGPQGNLFDPGKMGSYFQSREMIKANLNSIKNFKSYDFYNDIFELLSNAKESGLYITF